MNGRARTRERFRYTLPWRNDEDDTHGDALDVSPEAGLVGVGEGDVGEA